MPAYSFEAVDAEGQARKGLLEADTARLARSQLRAQGLIPLVVNLVSNDANADFQTHLQETGFWARLTTQAVFSRTDLAVWTRQLAGLVNSGLTLERSLTALAEECENAKQHQLMALLRAEVNAGSSFSKALSQHPREFSAIFIAVIAAGEQSGNLGLVLDRLADDLEASQNLRSKLIGAALYPAIVSLAALGIVLFLLGYVVPQVASVFTNSKRALPLLTVVMLGVSGFVRNYGWFILAIIISIAMSLKYMLKIDTFRQKFDAAWLEIPIIGRLAKGYNTARFASTLAMLTSAGVPILKALQAAADTLSNQALKSDALNALVLVREGAPLGSALAQEKRFPSLLSMFARLGEQTGQLPLMLTRAAIQISTEVQRRALQLATVLEPLLIIAMGIVVLLIVLAVLMPIIQLNQLVK